MLAVLISPGLFPSKINFCVDVKMYSGKGPYQGCSVWVYTYQVGTWDWALVPFTAEIGAVNGGDKAKFHSRFLPPRAGVGWY